MNKKLYENPFVFATMLIGLGASGYKSFGIVTRVFQAMSQWFFESVENMLAICIFILFLVLFITFTIQAGIHSEQRQKKSG